MDIKLKNIITVLLLLTVISCKKEAEVSPIVQDIKELVFASGELQWEDEYNLTAQTDGILKDANFEIGDKVLKGHILAKIDNRNNEINTETAREQLKISNENLTMNSPQIQQLMENIRFAESKYDQDKLQAERYQRLFESQSIAKVEYENMQLNAKNSLSNLNALRKQISLLQQQAKQQQISSKGQVKINSVIQNYNALNVAESGTIIEKLKTSGDYVRKGEIIATIANEQKVEAILNVDENNIGKIRIGQMVFVQLNTDKSIVYNGKVSDILPAFDAQTQSFICKVVFEKPFKISLFGTQLEANILVGEKKSALLIPRNYLGFGNRVRVKGTDEYTIIKPGIISTEYAEVLSGIGKNDVLLPLKK